MKRVTLNGGAIEYEIRGVGEPLLFIHGSISADAFSPLLCEPSIANRYRIVYFHRRGFGGSDRAPIPFSIAQQAEDCRALLEHLDIRQIHVVGHSFGAAIAMQWAHDAPDGLHSLSLLEPPLLHAIPSGPAFWEATKPLEESYRQGDKVGAVDGFMNRVVGSNYRQLMDKLYPPGAFELAVTDLDTLFQVENPALQQWGFTREEAQSLQTQHVLAVVGAETAPFFKEGHALLKQWLPRAEELVVPHATHGFQLTNPSGLAEGLAHFLAKHPL